MVSEMGPVNHKLLEDVASYSTSNEQTDEPSPGNIGLEFVRQYYTMLGKCPHLLFRFFSDDSAFIHGESDEPQVPVRGQKQIRAKIEELDFKNCRTIIRLVDSMETAGSSVIIKVVGELSNDGRPLRRFSQTFVLVPQTPNKYYVRNDIFRYVEGRLEIDEDEEDGEVKAVTAAEEQPNETDPASSDYVECKQEQFLAPESDELQAQMFQSLVAAAGCTPVPVSAKQEEEVHLPNGSPVEAIPVSAAGVNVAQVREFNEEPIASMDEIIASEKQRQAQNVAVASSPVSPPAAAEERRAEYPNGTIEHADAPKPAAVAAAVVPPPPSSNEPKTYASMLARKAQSNNVAMAANAKVIKKVEPTGSVAPAAAAAAGPSPTLVAAAVSRPGGDNVGNAVNSNAVPNIKSETVNNSSSNVKNSAEISPTATKRDLQAQNRFKKAGAIAPINNATSNQNAIPLVVTPLVAPAPAALVGTGGGSGAMPVNKRNDSKDRVRVGDNDETETYRPPTKYPDENQLFIGNLNSNVTEGDLRQVFERFGKILDIRINRQQNKSSTTGKLLHSFAFITYDDPEVVQTIVLQKSIYSGPQRFSVEAKRNNFGINNQSNYNRNRNNMGGGGRAGPPPLGGHMGAGGGGGGNMRTLNHGNMPPARHSHPPLNMGPLTSAGGNVPRPRQFPEPASGLFRSGGGGGGGGVNNRQQLNNSSTGQTYTSRQIFNNQQQPQPR